MRSSSPVEVRLAEPDFRARVARIQKEAHAGDVDAFILTTPGNVAYFGGVAGLGIGRPIAVVIPRLGEPSLVVPRAESGVAHAISWIPDIREYVEWSDDGLSDDWTIPLEAALTDGRVADGCIALELGTLSVALFRRINGRLPRATLVDAGPLVNRVRIIKDAGELAILRVAGRVGVAELAAAHRSLKIGAAEYELALAARSAGARAASGELGEDTRYSPILAGTQSIVAAGPGRTAWPHARASTRRVRDGEVVQVCYCGPAFRAYNIGLDRPLVVGSPAAEQQRILDVALDAHHAALSNVREGTRACDVHRAAFDVMAAAGMARYQAHRTGRGVGLDGAEPPDLRDADATTLRAGMVITIEPGVYVPGVGGARFGDTVAVTKDGHEMLTCAEYFWRGE